MSSRSYRLALGVTLGLVIGVSGCASEKAPINRVGTEALQKSFFVGDDLAGPQDDPQFFYRGYVVDNSTSNSQVSVGTWSHVDRIRWEITEDALIGRKAYQIIEGGDDHGLPSKSPDGTVVASFKISKHFDVRRDYDPSTGEEKNVIVENDTDRPWYQREFMRVDWSSNQVVDPMWGEMFTGSVFGDITVNPETYTVTDPTSDDAPHFEGANGYFDITNKYYLEPQAEFKDGDFSFPTCAWVGYLTGSATYECDAQEAKVRFSYVKIDDKESDFEPLDNTKASLDVVGNPGGLGDGFSVGVVTSGRQKFDPAYGYIDKNFKTFANIHNIWKTSHSALQCFTNTDANHNGTADECENAGASAGAQCDINALAYDVQAQYNSVQAPSAGGAPVPGLCTVPYREREVRKVAYWVNQEMPADLQDQVNSDGSLANASGLVDDDGNAVSRGSAEDIILSWNQLMRQSVAYAREVECRRAGAGARSDCHSQFFTGAKTMVRFGGWLVDQPKDTTDVLVVCHNPVRAYDDQNVCNTGNDKTVHTGETVRTGDIRRNMMVYWPYDTRAPYGGIADWNGDPLTGRIVGGMALTVGRSVTFGAAFARDVLQVALGDLTMNDIIENTPATTYQSHLQNGLPQPNFSAQQIADRSHLTNAAHAAQSMNAQPIGGSPAQQLSNIAGIQSTAQYDPASRQASMLRFDTRVAPLLGSKLETDLVSPSWLVGALGMDPTAQMSDSLLDSASPLRTMSELRVRDREDAYRSFIESQGACFTDMDTPLVGSVDLPGLAKYFGKKYSGMDSVARGQAIYNDLVKETFKGIELHEVGHSLGMLHQFASSWDSSNFTPQYWQLRTNEGQATADCKGLPRVATTNADGSPILDATTGRPLNDEQISALVNASADNCMGPRYLDPETLDEQGQGSEPRPGIDYFGNTSTMEYQFERFGESAGLGAYDGHAMKALYGRVLETFDDQVTPVADQQRFAARIRSQLNEQDIIDPGTGVVQPVHYTELARQLNRFDPNRDCTAATDAQIALGEWRIVHSKVCAPTPKDHASWNDFMSDALPTPSQVDPQYAPGSDGTAPFWHVDPSGPSTPGSVRWFYRWGSSDNSYIHTNPGDAGADVYEAAVNTRLKFEASYPFAYFRRKNREYQFWNIPSRVVHSYFSRMRTYHWDAAFRSATLRASQSAADYETTSQNDNFHRPYLMANAEAFNFLATAALMPQPGRYTVSAGGARSLQGYTQTALSDAEDPTTLEDGTTELSTLATTTNPNAKPSYGSSDYQFNLDVGFSRFIDDSFDEGPQAGGSWDYQQWMIHPGFQSEKAYAFGALVNGEPPVWIPSTQYFLDPRSQYASFYDDMPDGVERLLTGVIANDWDAVGVYGDPNDSAVLAALDARDQVELQISGVAESGTGASAKQNYYFTRVDGVQHAITTDGADTVRHKAHATANLPFNGDPDSALSDAQSALIDLQNNEFWGASYIQAAQQLEADENAKAQPDATLIANLDNLIAANVACYNFFEHGDRTQYAAGVYTGTATVTLPLTITFNPPTGTVSANVPVKPKDNQCHNLSSLNDPSTLTTTPVKLPAIATIYVPFVDSVQAVIDARTTEYKALRLTAINQPQGAPGSIYGFVKPKMLDINSTDPTALVRPAGAMVAFPNIGYQQQILGTVLAAAYSRENTDDTVVNKLRIWIDGVDGDISGEAIPNEADQVRFSNPASGFTYIARKYGNETIGGKSVEKGSGARMLLLANAYLAQTYKTTGAVDKFGGPVLELDKNGQPQLVNTDLSQNTELTNFIKYVGFIDGVRQVGSIFGAGPL